MIVEKEKYMFAQKGFSGHLVTSGLTVLMLLTALSDGRLFAQQQSGAGRDFFEMSLEELMDVPVVTASRLPQKRGELSVPVSIITAEDIHYSGLTSIGEILQFTPGVDMFKMNRYWDIVGIRGLHGMLSNRMQTLINGRLADNAVFGGPMFFTYPVILEDIDRIEIVRGPAGAALGANAFNGAINIITKRPEDVLGTFTSTTVTEFGDTYTHLRHAEKKDDWQWRVSANYEDLKTSDEALNGDASYTLYSPALRDLIGFDNYRVRDFARTFRFDSEAIYDAQNDTRISFGTGYSSGTVGDFEYAGVYPQRNNHFEQARPFVRVDHENGDESSSFLEWSGNFEKMNFKNFLIAKIIENSITGQYNFAPADSHYRSIGANLRWTHINADREPGEGIFINNNEPFDEYWAGLFGIDRWEATDRLTIEAQLRGDWYSGTQTADWSGRLTALYALDEMKDHIFRISAARAYRSPLSSLRKCTLQTVPLGGGVYCLNLELPGNLKNEEIFSLEAGYTGRLAQGVTLNIDTYGQRYNRVIGYSELPTGPGPFYMHVANNDGASAWGSEIELAFQNKKGKLSLWYAYNDFEEDGSHQDVRAVLPAKHKTGLTGRLFLPDGWTFNTNYKFNNTTPDSPNRGDDLASFHRLDLTIAREIAKGRGELMFGVSDVLDNANEPRRTLGNYALHEMPARTFFVRLQLKF